jgi:hypothetical protein
MTTSLLAPRNAGISAALFLTLLTHAATPPAGPPVREEVVLTGWLHVEDYTMEDVTVAVEVNGSLHVAPVSGTGRFTVTLPADAEAVLRFEKPGHLPKEVVVDTRHARDGNPGQRARRVKFAVILELERHMGGFTYPSPVGAIGFEQGGGCLAVTHDRTLVPPSNHKPMVF